MHAGTTNDAFLREHLDWIIKVLIRTLSFISFHFVVVSSKLTDHTGIALCRRCNEFNWWIFSRIEALFHVILWDHIALMAYGQEE